MASGIVIKGTVKEIIIAGNQRVKGKAHLLQKQMENQADNTWFMLKDKGPHSKSNRVFFENMKEDKL